jgi:small ligand-binding sensory domain FIST
VGQTIQFHVRDRRTAEEDFQLLLEAQKLHGGEGGALLFTCNGRGARLFGRPHADATMVREALGDMPLAGFFAAGELGPVGSQNFVHGHTASLVVFRPAT